MTSTTGVFCEHRRLRTSCPECKPVVAPRPPAAPRAAAKPAAKAAPGTVTGRKEAAAKEAAAIKGRVEMLPRRSKPKRVSSRAEAEKAEAWWTK